MRLSSQSKPFPSQRLQANDFVGELQHREDNTNPHGVFRNAEGGGPFKLILRGWPTQDTQNLMAVPVKPQTSIFSWK